jgi:hypothetical protein
MKFITAAISAAALSTVSSKLTKRCDWDMSTPFATTGSFSNTLKDGIRTIKPTGKENLTAYFKLKPGVEYLKAECLFTTVDLTAKSDFMTLGWYSSDSALGKWGNNLTIYPQRTNEFNDMGDCVHKNNYWNKWSNFIGDPVQTDPNYFNSKRTSKTQVFDGLWASMYKNYNNKELFDWKQDFLTDPFNPLTRMQTTWATRDSGYGAPQAFPHLTIEIKIEAGGHVSIFEEHTTGMEIANLKAHVKYL